MGALIQKKISITNEHKQFIENYKKWGFSDQSSIIRKALNHFINDFKIKERKTPMQAFGRNQISVQPRRWPEERPV